MKDFTPEKPLEWEKIEQVCFFFLKKKKNLKI